MSTNTEIVGRRASNVDSLERELEELKRAAMNNVSPQSDADFLEEQELDQEEPEYVATDEQEEKEQVLDKEEETFKKRYGDLRRHSQKVEKELRDKLKDLEEKLNQKQPSSMPTSPDQVKAWVEKFPDVAAVITALAQEQVTRTTTNIQKDLEELRLEKAKAEIRKKHADYDTIVHDDAFHDWAEAQPMSVQNAIYEGSPEDVIWALTAYKRDKGIKFVDPAKEAARVASKRSAVSEPKTETKGRFSESQVNRMSTAEYEANKDKIAEAMRKGQFVYDVTGAAR